MDRRFLFVDADHDPPGDIVPFLKAEVFSNPGRFLLLWFCDADEARTRPLQLSKQLVEYAQHTRLLCVTSYFQELSSIKAELNYLADLGRLRLVVSTKSLRNIPTFADLFFKDIIPDIPFFLAMSQENCTKFQTYKPAAQYVICGPKEDPEVTNKLMRFCSFATIHQLFAGKDDTCNALWALAEGTPVHSWGVKDLKEHKNWIRATLQTDIKTIEAQSRSITIRHNPWLRVIIWATSDDISTSQIGDIVDLYRRALTQAPVLINYTSFDNFTDDLLKWPRTKPNISPDDTHNFAIMKPINWAPKITGLTAANWEGTCTITSINCFNLSPSRTGGTCESPFCVIQCNPTYYFTTAIISRTNSPSFPHGPQELNIRLDNLKTTDKIEITIYDEDKRRILDSSSCRYLGRMNCSLAKLLFEMPDEDSFILEKAWVLKARSHNSSEKRVNLFTPKNGQGAATKADCDKKTKLRITKSEHMPSGFVRLTMKFDRKRA